MFEVYNSLKEVAVSKKDENQNVVVITLNYNQNDYTIDCVNSLLESNYSHFKILLVDNGSNRENYLDLKKRLPTDNRLVLERLDSNCGYVGGINHALEVSSQEEPAYFLIMNNDTLIDAEAIKELIATATKHDGNAIVSGKVYNYDEKDTLQYIGQAVDEDGMLNQRSIVKNRREKDVGQYDTEMEMGMLDDIFWLLPAKIYKTVGKYSDYFFLYGEQNDYGFRVLKERFKLIYTPNAKLWHKGGITTCGGHKDSPKIQYWTTFAVLKLAVLHLPSEKVKSYCSRWVLRQTVKHLLFFVLGKSKKSVVKAHFLAVWHFLHWNTVRYKDNGYNPFG